MTDSTTETSATGGATIARQTTSATGAGRPERAQWRGLLARAALLPVLVTLPLVNFPLIADHRFNVFQFGGDLAQRPWNIVVEPIRDIPRYLGLGNFRPLGRIVERAQDFLTFELSVALDLPITVTLRVVTLLFVGALGVAVVLLAETLSRRDAIMDGPPSAVGYVTSMALPAMLVAAGTTSAVVLFTSLYFASAVLVLLAAAVAARRCWFDTNRAGALALSAAFVGGAALAAFNEIGYLALPLLLLTVAARGGLTLGLRPRSLIRTKAAKMALSASLGFAAVFLPVRLLIARACADGSCYVASDVNISSEALTAFSHRLLSAVPLAAWSAAEGSAPGWSSLQSVGTVVLLLVIVVLTAWTVKRALGSALAASRGLWSLAAVGAALLVLSSAMMALSVEVQDRVAAENWPVGSGYRDLPLVAAAVALLAAAAAVGLSRSAGKTRAGAGPVLVATILVLGAAALVSTHENVEYAADQRPSANAELFDRFSLAMLHLDPAGDEARCELLDEFAEAYPKRDDWQRRLQRAVDTAATAYSGHAFCAGERGE